MKEFNNIILEFNNIKKEFYENNKEILIIKNNNLIKNNINFTFKLIENLLNDSKNIFFNYQNELKTLLN